MSDVLKIHVKNPTVNDHSLFFPGADVGIPLSLMGIYSYFPSRTPTRTELEECRVLLMTPEGSSWNPHSDVYTRNEESMLDWNGQMIEPKDRVRILLSDIKHMGKLFTQWRKGIPVCDHILTDGRGDFLNCQIKNP